MNASISSAESLSAGIPSPMIGTTLTQDPRVCFKFNERSLGSLCLLGLRFFQNQLLIKGKPNSGI